jgi:hypothetical protein
MMGQYIQEVVGRHIISQAWRSQDRSRGGEKNEKVQIHILRQAMQIPGA